MLDHISFVVRDFDESFAFYEKALAPLGITPLMRFPGVCGFGKDRKPFFWIGSGKPDFWGDSCEARRAPMHVAFSAKSRDEVAAFHAAALAAGGKDHGGPGIRAQYHPGYYGAFVIDPDGNNVEAVVHEHA